MRLSPDEADMVNRLRASKNYAAGFAAGVAAAIDVVETRANLAHGGPEGDGKVFAGLAGQIRSLLSYNNRR